MRRTRQNRFIIPITVDLPDLQTSPETWEAVWQDRLDRHFPRDLGTWTVNIDAAEVLMPELTEEALYSYMQKHKRLIQLQNSLASLALEAGGWSNFEQAWKEAGPAARKEYYLSVMKHYFEGDISIQEGRWIAPDLSLRSFESDDGEGYLNIVRKLAEERAPGRYTYIEHPASEHSLGITLPWDAYVTRPSSPRHLWQMQTIRGRMVLLTTIATLILQSFAYGFRLPTFGTIRTTRKKVPKITDEQVERYGALLGVPDADLLGCVRFDRCIYEYEVCTHCGKCSDSADASERYKACKKCKAIGRIVRYCSRECQTQDWKHADPPHKAICGTPTTELPSAAPQTVEPYRAGDIPPAAKGFVRSLALQSHMMLLRQNPTWGYIVIPPQPAVNWRVLRFSPAAVRVRNRAFRYGNSQSVHALYDIFAREQVSTGDVLTEDMKGVLRIQLEREFGIDVAGAGKVSDTAVPPA